MCVLPQSLTYFVCVCVCLFQGINGILADEMGLGKTVQSIALLAHLAEVSTFHRNLRNGSQSPWQQEQARAVENLTRSSRNYLFFHTWITA